MPKKSYKTPAWADPKQASVLDKPLTKAVRVGGQLMGADDPTSQVMGLGNVVWSTAPYRKAAQAAANPIAKMVEWARRAPGAIRQQGNQFAAEYGLPQILASLTKAAKGR